MVGLDVLRTDRTMVFYENKDNLSKLWDILAVYAWIDKEVGYCQGQCLLLAQWPCLLPARKSDIIGFFSPPLLIN
jgi:hypothetical protein